MFRNPGRPRARRSGGRHGETAGGFGAYVSVDGSGTRRRPLSPWLREIQDLPEPAEEGTSVRVLRDDPTTTDPTTTDATSIGPASTDLPSTDAPTDAPPDASPDATTTDTTDPTHPAPAIAAGVATPPSRHPVRVAAAPGAAPAAASRESAVSTWTRTSGTVRVKPLEPEHQPEPAPAPAPTVRPAPATARVLGVNIVGRVAFLSVVDEQGRAHPELVDHIVGGDRLEDAAQVADFSRRVAATLRSVNPTAVAVARPLRYAEWRYAEAFARVSLETCFMLEAHKQSIRFESVGQQHAANVTGLPLEKLLDALPARLRVDKSSHWADRAPAALVALALARQIRH